MQTEESTIVKSQSTNLPSMSYAEKISRRDFKQTRILNFLSDHEVFTTVAIVALLLEVSESSSRRALEQLVEAGMLISEHHYVAGHAVRLYGISHLGLIAVESDIEAPKFERGKVKSNYVQHKLYTQRIRIIFEKMGASFITERKVRMQKGLRKIPDGIGTYYLNDMRVPSPRIGIEIETVPKSFTRLNTVHANYLHTIEVDELIDSVLYLYPKKYLKGAIKLHNSLEQPAYPNRKNLEATRPYRFLFGPLEDFPNGIRFIDGSPVNFSAQIVPDIFE